MTDFNDLLLVNKCIRKGCTKPATNSLAINYLNKTGWFCDSCRDELIQEGLIMEIEGSGAPPKAPEPTPTQSSQVNQINDHKRKIR